MPAAVRVEQLSAAIGQLTTQSTPGNIQKQRELALYLAQLEQELHSYPNGERWLTYLDFPVPNDPETPGLSEDAAGQSLQQLLTRFNKVSSKPKYSKVTALPAFQAAQSSLKSFTKGNISPDLAGESEKTNETQQTAPSEE